MQAETKRFFSPYATWTRIPGSSSSSVSGDGDGDGDAITTCSEELMNSVGAAVDEYVSAYSSLLNPADLGSASSNAGPGAGADGTMKQDVEEEIINEDFLGEYLAYRTTKDPAKRLLTGE